MGHRYHPPNVTGPGRGLPTGRMAGNCSHTQRRPHRKVLPRAVLICATAKGTQCCLDTEARCPGDAGDADAKSLPPPLPQVWAEEPRPVPRKILADEAAVDENVKRLYTVALQKQVPPPPFPSCQRSRHVHTLSHPSHAFENLGDLW